MVFTLVFTINISEIEADSTLIAYYDFNGILTDSLSGSLLTAFGTENDGNNHNNLTSGFLSDAGIGGYNILVLDI